MVKRERDILQQIPGRDERWENYKLYTQGRLVRRFTEVGFKLLQTPVEMQAKLMAAVQKGLLNFDALPDEVQVPGAYKKLPAKFLDAYDFVNEIHRDLTSMHEQWIGGEIKLKPTSIYGIRMNRNGSSLSMHYDRVSTYCAFVIFYFLCALLNNICLFSYFVFVCILDQDTRDLVYYPHCSRV